MEIRKANAEDLESIRHLNRELFQYDSKYDNTFDMGWPDKEIGTLAYKKEIEDDNFFAQVLLDDKKVVGYMVCSLINTPPYMREDYTLAELNHTLISTTYRGRGFGKKMFENFKNWAKSKGVNLIKVNSSFGNKNAQLFYKKVGFTESNLILRMDL